MTASPQESSETAVIAANSSLRQEIVPQFITQAFQRLHHRADDDYRTLKDSHLVQRI